MHQYFVSTYLRALDKCSTLRPYAVPKAEELAVDARKAEEEGNNEKASELYMQVER